MSHNRAARTDLLRCRVVGGMPIRDYLSRESVQPGGEVVLAPRRPGKRPPADESVIDALVAGGAVEVLGPYVVDKPTRAKG